jgi:hypothetical protein
VVEPRKRKIVMVVRAEAISISCKRTRLTHMVLAETHNTIITGNIVLMGLHSIEADALVAVSGIALYKHPRASRGSQSFHVRTANQRIPSKPDGSGAANRWGASSGFRAIISFTCSHQPRASHPCCYRPHPCPPSCRWKIRPSLSGL